MAQNQSAPGAKIIGLLAGLSLVFSVVGVRADDYTAVPHTISYQGVIFDANNNPVTTPLIFRFSFWSDPDYTASDVTAAGAINTASAGFADYQEVQQIEPDRNGNFQTLIGAQNPLPVLDPTVQKYLQVEVKKTDEADTAFELLDVDGSVDNAQDRKLLASVPYALLAETLDGYNAGYEAGQLAPLDGNAKLHPDAIPNYTTAAEFALNALHEDEDTTLKFGNQGNLKFDAGNQHFDFNRGLYIAGNLTLTGSQIVEGDLDVRGLINGRDWAADFAKLDNLSTENQIETAADLPMVPVFVPAVTKTITCSSSSWRWQECEVAGMSGISEIKLESLLSNAPCELGVTFGITEGTNKIWVDDGCRGEFTVAGSDFAAITATDVQAGFGQVATKLQELKDAQFDVSMIPEIAAAGVSFAADGFTATNVLDALVGLKNLITGNQEAIANLDSTQVGFSADDFTAQNVHDALVDLKNQIPDVPASVDMVASAIAFASQNFAATNVQDALNELFTQNQATRDMLPQILDDSGNANFAKDVHVNGDLKIGTSGGEIIMGDAPTQAPGGGNNGGLMIRSEQTVEINIDSNDAPQDMFVVTKGKNRDELFRVEESGQVKIGSWVIPTVWQNAAQTAFSADGFAAQNVQDALVALKNEIPTVPAPVDMTASNVTFNADGFTATNVYDALVGLKTLVTSSQNTAPTEMAAQNVTVQSTEFTATNVLDALMGLKNLIASSLATAPLGQVGHTTEVLGDLQVDGQIKISVAGMQAQNVASALGDLNEGISDLNGEMDLLETQVSALQNQNAVVTSLATFVWDFIPGTTQSSLGFLNRGYVVPRAGTITALTVMADPDDNSAAGTFLLTKNDNGKYVAGKQVASLALDSSGAGDNNNAAVTELQIPVAAGDVIRAYHQGQFSTDRAVIEISFSQ